MAIEELIAEGRAYVEERYPQEIEQNRKGDFSVSVQKNGVPLQNAEIRYELERIDFDFGCNLFMLGQYDSAQQEETYLSQWKNLFNTAVLPFYWEGTEPEQGRLRYSADAGNDVYRRPPIDTVVEYCQKNGLALKGHPLFWHEFIPEWLPESWSDLYPLLEKRFREISERYADTVPVFDCVNEPSRLWDLQFECRSGQRKCVYPPEGYLEQVFALGEKYFPNNELILNEATDAAFVEYRGIYGGYYLLLEKLLKEGLKIDRIGLQCHISDSPRYKNIFNGERLYRLLDGYGRLGKPLVLSEIGLHSEDEELQALATEQLYKICFSHGSMSGIFWWNLDDNSILTNKNRTAGDENLPSGGLCRNGRKKAAYQVLDRLIRHEWNTTGSQPVSNGTCAFRGFYGKYRITVSVNGTAKEFTADFGRNAARNIAIEL